MVMDGHCETALVKICCLASDVTAQFRIRSLQSAQTYPQIWKLKMDPT